MNEEFRLLPEQASSLADDVDRLYAFLWGVSGVMTVLIGGLILYFAIKYRRGSRVDRTITSTHFFAMEIAWIIGPFVVVMVMFFWGADLYFRQSRPPANAMEITGVGRQWMWKFQHPEGRSEINDLHVPLGQPIKVRLISEDVIHSLFVPAMRVKMDVLPGRYTALWFTPTKLGRYHLFCAEYCGAKHSEMKGYVYVMEPSRYQEWLAGQSQTAVARESNSLLEELRCTSCHQGGGPGSRGPSLAGLLGSTVRLQNGQTVVADENYIRESIVRPQAKIVAGYGPLMPSFEGQVDEEGLNRLLAEIRALAIEPSADGRGEAPPGSAPAEDGARRDKGPESTLKASSAQPENAKTTAPAGSTEKDIPVTGGVDGLEVRRTGGPDGLGPQDGNAASPNSLRETDKSRS